MSATRYILDLDGYQKYKLESCLKDKMECLVMDEGGLLTPLSISLVIPTKFYPDKLEKLEKEALHTILSECSKLVDAGYIDEIIVIGATQDQSGRPVYNILEDVVRVAYEELGLFREQVNLINRFGSQRELARRGLIDFFVKVVHQFDGNISRLLAKYGVYGTTGYFGMPVGKGAGLWLAVPISQGDVLCFADADILNFKKEFIAALCHPIIFSWDTIQSAIKFVKAYYTRLTINKDHSEEQVFLGGRASRLLMTPLIQATVETLGVFSGLEDMKFPLAGEFSISRDTLEQISFPSTYAVETMMLFQLWDLLGLKSMAQIDLGVYHHIGRPLGDLKKMAVQIVNSFFQGVEWKLGRVIDEEEKNGILTSYIAHIERWLKIYEEDFRKLEESTIIKPKVEIVYSRSEDEKRGQLFEDVIRDLLFQEKRSRNEDFVMLPSWNTVKERAVNYFALREMLRRRSNQSTWSRLVATKLTNLNV